MDENNYADASVKRRERRAAFIKRKRRRATVVLFIFLGIFIISLAKLTVYFLENKMHENAFKALEQIVAEERAQAETDISNTELQTSELNRQILPEYAELYGQNQDLWGWIKIDGTSLSYPVMHTSEDSEKYLRMDFDGNYSQMGVPFLDGNCYEQCGNYIVYGHNMKNGKMFAPIVSYKDESFYEEHPAISFDTLYEHNSYSVIAAFYSKAYYKDDTDVFRYYQYTDLTDLQTFDEYIEQVKAAAIYETDADVNYGDQLLTLSTCSYHSDNGRFVVVAKKN